MSTTLKNYYKPMLIAALLLPTWHSLGETTSDTAKVANLDVISSSDTSLLPLRKGDQWKSWSATADGGRNFFRHYFVTEHLVHANEPCFKIERGEMLNDKVIDKKIVYYLSIKEDGLVSQCDADDTEWYCILKPNSRTAQTWDTQSSDKNYDYTWRHNQFWTTVSYKGKDIEAVVVNADIVLAKMRGFPWKEVNFNVGNRKCNYYLPGQGLTVTETSYIKSDGSRSEIDRTEFESTGDVSAALGSFLINKGESEREAWAETIDVLPGVITETTKSRTIKHELNFTTKQETSTELEARLEAQLLKVKGRLSAKIRGSIEVQTGKTFQAEETRSETIKIDGDKLSKARISWVDIYKEGIIQTTLDGKIYDIPFSFPIGTKLTVKKAD